MPDDDLLTTARRLLGENQLTAAAELCRRALLAAPLSVPATRLLAKIARRAGNLPAAERLLQHALAHSPGLGDAELWVDLGLTLRAAHRLREAAQAFGQAALADPRLAVAWGNLAAIHCELQNWHQAGHAARRAIEIAPRSPQAWINLAEALHNQGNVAAQTACLERAVAVDPQCALAHWNLSLTLLLAGNFERGWQHYEWRERAGQVSLDAYPYPRWNGASLADSILLVHGEQGVGDEILFASCYAELIGRARHCVLVCDVRLASLLRRSFPTASVIGYQRRKDHMPVALSQPADCQIPAGSVPQFFRRAAENFPRREKFLHADPAAVAAWRGRLAALGGSLRIGISWRAGGQPAEHRKRSTNLADWRPLFALSGIDWINLQYGDTGAERAWALANLGTTIHNWDDADPLVDLDACAAQLSALDLVISVGNATVHLAGALGVPAWAVLPQIPNWRWGLSGEQSVWYASVRLIRQQPDGGWRAVFQRLAHDLQGRLGGATLTPGHETPLQSRSAGDLCLAPAPAVPVEVADMQATLRQALAHFQAGRLDAAEALCRAALSLAPRQVSALQLMAALNRHAGRLPAALDCIRRALSVQERPELCHELALVLLAANRRGEGIAELERALALDAGFLPAAAELNRLRSAATALPVVTPPIAAPLAGPHWPQHSLASLPAASQKVGSE